MGPNQTKWLLAMTDVAVGQPDRFSSLSQLCNLCVPDVMTNTTAKPNSQLNQALVSVGTSTGQAAGGREENRANSGRAIERSKSQSGSDDEDFRGAESNVRSHESRLKQGAAPPKYGRSTNNARSGSGSGNSQKPSKIRKTSHINAAECATNSGGSSDNTKSGSGDDNCGGSSDGGPNRSTAA